LTAYLIPQRGRARVLGLSQFKNEIEDMKSVLSTQRFDVIHAHWTYEFALAALAVDGNALITAHDAPLTILRSFNDPYRFFRMIMAVRVRLRAKNLTFVSPYLASRWDVEMKWKEKGPVIPNISPFSPSKSVELSEKGKILVTIGDATTRKNIRNLLLAMSYVREEIPGALLHVFGNDLSDSGILAEWAVQQNLNEGIIWHGYVDRSEIELELSRADLMIHPSLEEAQPMVLLEAMSLGIPVLAGKYSGGVPWSLGEAGVLVDVENPLEIAKSAIEILNSIEIRKDMVSEGLRLVSTKYSPKEVSDSYLHQYKKIYQSHGKDKP
jgi:glycosyltransferase involved in cell wall biosynthesis